MTSHLFPHCHSGPGSAFLGDGPGDDSQTATASSLHPYEVWWTEVSCGISLFEQQKHQAGPEDGDYNSASLVAFQSEGKWKIEFFQWKEPGISGRVSSMGEDKRLKSIVAVGSRRLPIQLSETNGHILWRNTGARVVKSQWKRNQEQSLVPDSLRRFCHMAKLACGLDIADAADAARSSSDSDICFLCNKASSSTLPVEKARRCCLCMLASHRKCCDEVVRCLGELVSRRSPCQPPTSNPKRARRTNADLLSGSDDPLQFLTVPSVFPTDFRWPWPSPFNGSENMSERRGWFCAICQSFDICNQA